MHGVKFVVSDDHMGLRAARKAELGSVLWQRCQFHLQQNAQGYVPRKAMKKQVASEIRGIFGAPDLETAQILLGSFVKHYRNLAPELADWAEENVPDGFSVFALPEAHRRRLRTSNSIERLNQEIERRVKVIRTFPNTESLLRLVTTLLVEQSEEWETGRIYLSMDDQQEDETDSTNRIYRKDVA